MYWIHSIVIFILLNNVENFKLIQNKIRSRLQTHPFELKAITPVARDLHTCLINCYFELSFNDPLVRPETCNSIETDSACEISITINYEYQSISFYSYENAESLTIDNITYDSATIHLAYFEVSNNLIYHFFDYTCGTGNDCDWKYAQQIIPKLISLDYQSLFNLLLSKVYNSNGHPNMTQCFRDTELINCSSGTCEFFQSVDDDYNLQISRDCSIFQDSSIEIGNARYIPGPAKHDYDIIGFTCNQDQCNDQANEYEIKEIISSNGNEFININSLGTKFQITSFSLYFLVLFVIKYLK
jgi:hypothetical protein